jgi:hypothetical protein
LTQRVRLLTTVSVWALLLAGALAVDAADLTIVSQVTAAKQPPMTSTLYLGANKVRNAQDKSDIIFELATGRLTMVDHQKKQYWETTMDEIDATLKQADQQMNERMANIPPAMRQRMAGLLGGGGSSVTVTKGAGTRVIAGHTCEQYTIKAGTSYTAEEWVARDLQVPMQYWSLQRAQFVSNPMLKGFAQVAEEMKKLKGLTLAQTVSIKGPMGMNLTTTSEALEVKAGPIPPATFEVPGGYKKVASPSEPVRSRSRKGGRIPDHSAILNAGSRPSEGTDGSCTASGTRAACCCRATSAS